MSLYYRLHWKWNSLHWLIFVIVIVFSSSYLYTHINVLCFYCYILKPVYACMIFLSTDIDECISGSAECHDNATCTNTDSSYECSCDAGFSGDGFNCTSEIHIIYCILLLLLLF